MANGTVVQMTTIISQHFQERRLCLHQDISQGKTKHSWHGMSSTWMENSASIDETFWPSGYTELVAVYFHYSAMSHQCGLTWHWLPRDPVCCWHHFL